MRYAIIATLLLAALWTAGTAAQGASGARGAPPSGHPTAASRGLPRGNQVARIQAMLAELGYDPGPADGVLGGKTRAAIRSYQSHSGLPVDGQPSAALHAELAADLGYPTEPQPRAREVAPVPRLHAGAGWDWARRRDPEPAAGGAASGDIGRLLGQLRNLLARAERERAADPELLDELRRLLARYGQPRAGRVLVDRFDDGDYTRAPAWQVAAGEFRVDWRSQLRTRVATAARRPQRRTTSKNELPLAILGAILGQPPPGSSDAPAAAPAAAEIYLPRKITSAFEIEVELLSAGSDGQLELGVYRGAQRRLGYRLTYRPGADTGLALVRRDATGDDVVAQHRAPVRLEDQRAHRLQWRRERSGRFTVSLDGEVLLRAWARDGGRGFDGFHIVNRGGDYAFAEVRIVNAE